MWSCLKNYTVEVECGTRTCAPIAGDANDRATDKLIIATSELRCSIVFIRSTMQDNRDANESARNAAYLFILEQRRVVPSL